MKKLFSPVFSSPAEILSALLPLVFLIACTPAPVKVALMTKLDAGSLVGSSEVNAARLFQRENPGVPMEVIPFDDGWDPSKALAVVRELEASGFTLAVTSHVSVCAVAIAEDVNRIPILTLATGATTDALSGQADFIFRNVGDVISEQTALAQAISPLGFKKILVLRDGENDAYTAPAARTFSKHLPPETQIQYRDILPSALDPDALRQLMAGTEYDLLYLLVGGYKSIAGNIAQISHRVRPEAVILYTPWMKTPGLLETAGESITHSLLPSHYPPKGQDPRVDGYLARFKAEFGYTPTFISLNVYQALEILTQALKEGNRTPKEIKNYLETKREFTTSLGTVTMDAYGDTLGKLYLISDIPREFE